MVVDDWTMGPTMESCYTADIEEHAVADKVVADKVVADRVVADKVVAVLW